MPIPISDASAIIDSVIDKHADDLVEFRRDLHIHPELSWSERRSTDAVAERLIAAGVEVTRLSGTGLLADIGDRGPLIGLRADLDALPVDDTSATPWASRIPGVAHACGHDVHTAGLVGAGLALAEVHARGQLPGRVRLLFQPAEEVMPGGALFLMDQGALDDMEQIFMLHCDPTLDVGEVGIRAGALTGAADALSVRLAGQGGHTSRPHLTADLTYALAKLVTELPSILSRRLDPRAGVSVVWGMVRAGTTHNVIPETGQAAGTIRMLDPVAWADAEALVRVLIDEIVAPYGVTAEVDYRKGVPPVVNELRSAEQLAAAVRRVVGSAGQVQTTQSLGGEDFGWYLERVPGAMGRIGTRSPGGPRYDLHQGNIVVDEGATTLAARVLAGVAVTAMAD